MASGTIEILDKIIKEIADKFGGKSPRVDREIDKLQVSLQIIKEEME